MDWKEIASKEGALYCTRKDTWCCFNNFEDGSCTRPICIFDERDEIERLRL